MQPNIHKQDQPVSHPLFHSHPALWAQVADAVRVKHFANDDRIVSHSDEASGLWLVLKGWVTLSRQTPDGKETIIGLCTEGDIFGEAALFPNANYPYTAEASGKETELAMIPAPVIRAQVAKNGSLSNHIMSMLSDRVGQAQLKLEQINTMSASQRLGCFLLRLCVTQESGSKTLHIPIEKNILAAYLGMKPETFSRSQQQLKPLGILVSGDKVNIENISALREFVCGSCSESGSCDVEDAAE